MMTGGVDLGQVPFRQTMKAQQQVIVVLLHIRLGTGHQRIEVFRLIVERLENRELHVEFLLPNHPLGFFDHCGHGAIGELRIERRQGDFFVPLSRQTNQHRLNGWLAVAHRQLYRPLSPLRSHGPLQTTAEYHQWRAVRPPDRRISVGRLLWAFDQNQRHQQTPHRPWQVDHIRVHQKLIEVAAHIRHRGGSG